MAKKKAISAPIAKIEAKFPIGGVVRRFAYQQQEPYTAPNALNVWPQSYPDYRLRGVRRDGLSPLIREVLGTPSPINMLASVAYVERQANVWWADDFLVTQDKQIAGSWTSLDTNFAQDRPKIDRDHHLVPKEIGRKSGAWRTFAQPPIDFDSDYLLEVFVAPITEESRGQIDLIAQLSNADPKTNSIIASLIYDAVNGFVIGRVETWANSVRTSVSESTPEREGFASSGWFTIRKRGNELFVYWRKFALLSVSLVDTNVANHPGFGFALQCNDLRSLLKLASFRFQYRTQDIGYTTSRKVLVALAGGKLHRETFMGSVGVHPAPINFNATEPIQAVEYQQKLYIADYGPSLMVRQDGRSLNKQELTTTEGVDFVQAGVDLNTHVVSIFGPENSAVKLGTYHILVVRPDALLLDREFADGGAAQVYFRIEPGPKVYDPVLETIRLWNTKTNKGSVPAGQKIMAIWRDRLILAGGDDSPHNWYMSRAGDPEDWLYGNTDPGTAVAGVTGLAGRVGEPITALIPHRDSCLYIGTTHTIWVLQGDPAAGGQMQLLSERVGIVSKTAWTVTSQFEIVFLSHDGLYVIAEPCATTPPVMFSREKLPAELLNISPDLFYISMTWDHREKGIHLALSPRAGGTGKYWFIDWQNKAFWPIEYPESMEPTSAAYYQAPHAAFSGACFGCRDGYIRHFRPDYWRDDDKAIQSYIDIGPLNLGGLEYFEGIITLVETVLGETKGKAQLEIITASHAEATHGKSPQYQGPVLAEGLNVKHYPRTRGGAGLIRLSGVGDAPWSIESLWLTILRAGWRRVAT